MTPETAQFLLSPWMLALLGLMIGSFLNVVIHRLPQMMERDWKIPSAEMLDVPFEPPPAISLWRPGSRCPSCGHAIRWYEAAIKINRTNPQVHTDLALSLFYTNEIDRALREIDAALAIDPRHLKALLSQGFIRAFGKQDLPGAVKAWEQVIAVDPSSVEAGEARRQIDGLKGAHPAVAGNGRGGGKRP